MVRQESKLFVESRKKHKEMPKVDSDTERNCVCRTARPLEVLAFMIERSKFEVQNCCMNEVFLLPVLYFFYELG